MVEENLEIRGMWGRGPLPCPINYSRAPSLEAHGGPFTCPSRDFYVWGTAPSFKVENKLALWHRPLVLAPRKQRWISANTILAYLVSSKPTQVTRWDLCSKWKQSRAVGGALWESTSLASLKPYSESPILHRLGMVVQAHHPSPQVKMGRWEIEEHPWLHTRRGWAIKSPNGCQWRWMDCVR